MFLHSYLIDPISRTAVMEDNDFYKYVEICNRQVGPTDPDLVRQIREKFMAYSTISGATVERANYLWGFMEPKLAKNEGLARFTLDNRGAESFYFFPWLVNVMRSPSAALEMAYGAGEDLNGNWTYGIENLNDPIRTFIENDPTFVYNRERELFMAELVERVRHWAFAHDTLAKVVDFGAGRLAWTRWHGMSPEETSSGVEIYAFDRDPSIKLEDLYEFSLEELGIHFKHGDLFAQLKNPDCREADLISLLGLVSYIPRDAFATQVLPAIHGLLKPNRDFFFDLQLDCPYYQRSMKLWDWPEIDLQKDVGSAITMLEGIRKDLWQREIRFRADYIPDTFNRTPSSLMVVMTKLE